MKTHFFNTAKALTAAALLTGSIAVTAPAYAINAQGDTVTTTIDLRDLKTDQGIARVYKALSRRAKNACETPGIKPIESRAADKACAEKLLTEFVEDIGHEQLTAYYDTMQS